MQSRFTFRKRCKSFVFFVSVSKTGAIQIGETYESLTNSLASLSAFRLSNQLCRRAHVEPTFDACNDLFSTFVCLAPTISSAKTSQTSTYQSIPPAVAAELDAMRHRIEQLEQELRQNKANSTQPPAAVSSGTPDVSPSVQNLVANSAPTAQPSSPDKPQKEEPFSYADWTWLNGNPRTKTIPMDTKFF